LRFVIIATAVAAVTLAGCGKKEEATTVTTTGEGYGVSTRDGRTVSIQAAAPQPPPPGDAPGAPPAPPVGARTPDFAPLYPGATLKATTTTTTNGHQVGSVTYLTAAAPQAVIDFYKPKAAAAGFATSADANIGVGLMYAATDAANQRPMQVIATTEKAGTAVVLSWTSPKS
jgi:hypothetical protein